MNSKTIESLEDRIATLEFNLQQLEAQVSRIFGEPSDCFQLPTGLIPLKQSDCDEF
ncbi:hypothetical protein KAI46_13190 [bacterium]|nr:hypothetical protein [bacterium]